VRCEIGQIELFAYGLQYALQGLWGWELHISPKHAHEICRTLKGMRANLARAYLEDVIALKRAIPFKRYRRNVAHRHGAVGWDAGRYPEKAPRQS